MIQKVGACVRAFFPALLFAQLIGLSGNADMMIILLQRAREREQKESRGVKQPSVCFKALIKCDFGAVPGEG